MIVKETNMCVDCRAGE